MAAALGHLFTDQANAYAQHRPDYPDELYQAVEKLGNVTGKELALDVATGTGQVAHCLANTFDRVIGIDDSEGQLKHAAPHPKIKYMQGTAEDMSNVSDASVDLLTVGQALHWFDHDRFYREARRVLKPEGALAAWTYDYGSILPGRDCPTTPSEAAVKEVNDAFIDFHSGPSQIGPYWDKRREIVLKRYQTVMPGPEHFSKVQRLPEGMPMERQWSLNDLEGLFRSWSGYTTFLKQCPDVPDPMPLFLGLVQDRFGIKDPAQPATLCMQWPLYGFVATKPRPVT